MNVTFILTRQVCSSQKVKPLTGKSQSGGYFCKIWNYIQN